MKVILKAFLLFLICLVCACSQKQELIEINIDKQLADFAKNNDPSGIDLCSAIPLKTWDEIVVIGPYSTEDRLKPFKIKNLATVKDKVLSESYDEGECMLVYLKNKEAIAYSVVSRFPVDFVMNGADVYSFKYEQCDSIVFIQERDKRFQIMRVGK